MNEKHQEVQLWLEKLYGGDQVPDYELNETTVSTLHDLMRKNEKRDTDMQLIIEDLRQKADEYNGEGRRLEKILRSIGLTSTSLSQSGVMSQRTLVNLALLLQIKDSSESSYMLGLEKLQDELYKTEDCRQMEQRTTEKLIDKTKTAILKYNSLKKALEVLEQQSDSQHPETEKRAKTTGFLHSKSKEYKNSIHHYQNLLSKSGVDPALYHGELVKTSEELKALEEQLAPKRSKLQTYHSLPPDVSLTKVKVEELKQKLVSMEAELSKKIDLMHM